MSPSVTSHPRTLRWTFILAAAVFACLCERPIAAESLPAATDTIAYQDSLPIYHLGEIITVRGRKDTPVSSVSDILGTSIKMQGSTNVTGALSGAPGLIVTAGSKGESRVQIRGFQSQETLVLYDGRPVALPYYGDLDLTTIPLSNISKISVVKGPAPALYGANSMGGVINIVSQRVSGRPVRELRMSAAENAGYDALLNYGDAAGRFDWWLSAGRSSSDGYDLSDDFEPNSREDGGLRYNSDYRHVNVDGKLNYTLASGTLFSFSAGAYDAVRGLPTGTDRAQYQRYPLWRRWYADAGADGQFGSHLHWKGKLYYDDCENRLKRWRDSAMTDPNLVFDSYHDSYDWGALLNADVELTDRARNATSLNLRRDGIKRQEDTGKIWLENQITTSTLSDQFEYQFNHAVRTELGGGYSYMTSKPDGASTDAVDIYGGVKYAPRSWLDLHATASRVTRFPTLNQLYASTSGNPDLGPERAVKLELGYGVKPVDHLTFTQAYFRSDVAGLIDRKHRDSLYENLEDVDLSGIESGLSYDTHRGGISLNYMYLDAYEFNTTTGGTIRDRRSHSPRHKIDYQVYVKTGFGLSVSHTGQSIVDRVDPNKQPMRDYFLAHVRAAYRVATYVELFVNVRNLFDTNYEEERYYPMPGRLVAAGAEVKF
ncbi:MAG: TonB-dependent receptor [Candidatus Zixiibacteriota bacterium]